MLPSIRTAVEAIGQPKIYDSHRRRVRLQPQRRRRARQGRHHVHRLAPGEAGPSHVSNEAGRSVRHPAEKAGGRTSPGTGQDDGGEHRPRRHLHHQGRRRDRRRHREAGDGHGSSRHRRTCLSSVTVAPGPLQPQRRRPDRSHDLLTSRWPSPFSVRAQRASTPEAPCCAALTGWTARECGASEVAWDGRISSGLGSWCRPRRRGQAAVRCATMRRATRRPSRTRVTLNRTLAFPRGRRRARLSPNGDGVDDEGRACGSQAHAPRRRDSCHHPRAAPCCARIHAAVALARGTRNGRLERQDRGAARPGANGAYTRPAHRRPGTIGTVLGEAALHGRPAIAPGSRCRRRRRSTFGKKAKVSYVAATTPYSSTVKVTATSQPEVVRP